MSESPNMLRGIELTRRFVVERKKADRPTTEAKTIMREFDLLDVTRLEYDRLHLLYLSLMEEVE